MKNEVSQITLDLGLRANPQWTARAESFIAYAHAQLLQPLIGASDRAYLFSESGLKLDTWDAFHLGYNPADLYESSISLGFNSSLYSNLLHDKFEYNKIFIPYGLVIPDLANGLPRYIKIRRPPLLRAGPGHLRIDPRFRPFGYPNHPR